MSEQDLRDKLDAAEAEAEAKSAGEEKERPEGEAADVGGCQQVDIGVDGRDQNARVERSRRGA